MNLEFSQIVDECIAQMRAGASLESCLERYPQFAEDLRPVLQTVRNLQALKFPQERSASVQAGRQRLLNAYAKKAAIQPVSESSLSRFIQQIFKKLTGRDDLNMKLVARFAIALLLVAGLIVGGGITATASASALPGDTLYPVKLGLENVNLLFANDPQVRQQLEQQYQAARQKEVQSILKLGRQTTVHFVGVLSAVNPDGWIIGGLPVKLDGGTQIVGAATIGSIIDVIGETKVDGTLLAHTLTVQGQTNNSPYPVPGSTIMPGSTLEPTGVSTMMSTNQPTSMPTMMSTNQPTSMPTMMPTHQPTSMPTMMPPIHPP